MQGRVQAIILAMLAAALSSGCASWFSHRGEDKESQTGEKKVLPPLHLGAVHQVYPAQKFAVLRIIGPVPAPGTTLISHPADGSTARIGNLMVSENSSPRSGMLIADIRSGSVVSGDRVFLYRNISPPDETDLEKVRAQNNKEVQGEIPKPPPLRFRVTGTSSATAEQAPQTSSGEDDPVVETPTPSEETSAPVESTSAEPSAPVESPPTPPTTPHKHPDYIDDIPDNIDDWN